MLGERLSILSCEIRTLGAEACKPLGQGLSILSCEISTSARSPALFNAFILSILSCEISRDLKPPIAVTYSLSILSCEISLIAFAALLLASRPFNSLLRDQEEFGERPDLDCVAAFQFSLARSVAQGTFSQNPLTAFNSLLRDQTRKYRMFRRQKNLSILSCEISDAYAVKVSQRPVYLSILSCEIRATAATESCFFLPILSILSCEISLA
jgi:hypothetical protein